MERFITIVWNDGIVQTFTMQYNLESTKDSDALYIALCYCDPGDDYAVTFSNNNSWQKVDFYL